MVESYKRHYGSQIPDGQFGREKEIAMVVSRKIAGSFVVFVTTLPLAVFIFFIAQQKFMRWQMEEKLEKEQLTSVTISAQDFKWFEEGKEIIINNHLFDVKSITRLKGDQLLITGLYDYQEQKLHKDLDNFMNNKGSSSKQDQYTFFKWLSQLYDDNVSSPSLYANTSDTSENQLFHTHLFKRLSLNVPTPPPRIMFL
jgi:hypothetical protein